MKTKLLEKIDVLLLLNRLVGGSPAAVSKKMMEGEDPVEIFERIKSENYLDLQEPLEILEKKFSPEREKEKCQKEGIRLLTLCDADYPELLKEIYDPPILLYVRGSLASGDSASLAVVGSRHATSYGLYHARKFSREIAESGFTIVSGLARGIDQAAHEGALEIPAGRTLAVLGCGIDQIYPKESGDLYRRVAERGAVISEYSLGAEPLAQNFPKRNRIISGLSLGVLVVEAHVRSGSLITARLALDQGREVFAVPGRIDQLTSHGTHELLRNGACLTDTFGVMVEALGPEARRRMRAERVPLGPEESLPVREASKSGLKTAQSRVGEMSSEAETLMRLLGHEDVRFEDLQIRSGFGAEVLFSNLLSLEITRRIVKQPNGAYRLNVR